MDGQSNKILISIVAFCDTELTSTILDALEKAQYPENITMSVFEQDVISHKQSLEALITSFGANVIYQYCSVEDTQGVVWARNKAATPLQNNSYDYYLQVDSHMRFSMHYDSFLINTYKHALDYWGPFVWTAYCPGYKIIDGQYVLEDTELQSTFAIVHETFPSRLVGCIKTADKDKPYGELALQVSGHFLFGSSNIFIDHPFDPYLYWEGEESTYAARLYADNIKTISPPRVYLWHKYESPFQKDSTRKRHSNMEKWDNQEFMNKNIKRLHQRGLDRCNDFWDNGIDDIYGVSLDKIHQFLYLEDRSLPEKYATIGFESEE